ncbi:MAG: hypothetical protein ACT4TC_09765, partial [Myxococcaceae bacterium]
MAMHQRGWWMLVCLCACGTSPSAPENGAPDPLVMEPPGTGPSTGGPGAQPVDAGVSGDAGSSVDAGVSQPIDGTGAFGWVQTDVTTPHQFFSAAAVDDKGFIYALKIVDSQT